MATTKKTKTPAKPRMPRVPLKFVYAIDEACQKLNPRYVHELNTYLIELALYRRNIVRYYDYKKNAAVSEAVQLTRWASGLT